MLRDTVGPSSISEGHKKGRGVEKEGKKKRQGFKAPVQENKNE